MTALTLLSSTPSDNEKDVALDSSIVLNFSEDVIKGEGYINILYQTHGFGYTPLPWSTPTVSGYGTSQLTITPGSRFVPEYFYWLKFIMEKLDYRSSDLRIITNNFHIRAIPKYKLLPDFLYGKLNFYFPELYNWNLPTNLNEIMIRKLSKSGFAHGCGLIPLGALRKIGGYNSELIGHGPEDDLFNQRIKFYSRVYYHKGNYRSSTFHLPHPPLNQQNRLNNFKYWFDSLEDIKLNGLYSDLIRR